MGLTVQILHVFLQLVFCLDVVAGQDHRLLRIPVELPQGQAQVWAGVFWIAFPLDTPQYKSVLNVGLP